MGGYGQFQAAARRHAAGRPAAAAMADRQGRDGSRARKVGAGRMSRLSIPAGGAHENDREDDRRELQRALQDRAADRPAGPLRHLRHPDEPADVQIHHGQSSEYQSRTGRQCRSRDRLSRRARIRPAYGKSKSFGSFMLKVSWKILSPAEIQAKNFHMVEPWC